MELAHRKSLSINIVLLFVFLLVSIIPTFFNLYASQPLKVLTLGFVSFLFSFFFIIRRLRTVGISDPVVIFLSFFTIYNSFVVMNYAYLLEKGVLLLEMYPASFSGSTLLYAGFLSLTANIGFIMGVEWSAFSSKDETITQLEVEKYDYNLLTLLGILSYSIGIALYFESFQAVGGFLKGLFIDRLTRLSILASSHSLPYAGFILVGIAIVFLSFLVTKKRYILLSFLLSFGTWSMLLILEGDRRLLLYTVFIVLVIWGLIRGDKFIRSLKTKQFLVLLTIVFVSYIFGAFFARTRFIFPLLISKFWTFPQALLWIRDHISLDWFMPASIEFGGPYFSLLYNIQNNVRKLYGSSYAFSIPYLLPRSLYPGVKAPTLAENFANNIHDQYYAMQPTIKGWGYSPVAEAFQNFGGLGVFIVFSLLGYIINMSGRLRYKNLWSILIYLVIVPELINLNRIVFASVFQEFIFFIPPIIMIYVLYEILIVLREAKL